MTPIPSAAAGVLAKIESSGATILFIMASL